MKSLLLVILLMIVVIGIPVAASPRITEVSPASLPNDGEEMIMIAGSGFTFGSTVWISSCTTGEIVHGEVLEITQTTLTTSFPLGGVKPGTYNVYVNSPFTDPFGNYYSSDGFEKTNALTISQSAYIFAISNPSEPTTKPAIGTPIIISGQSESSPSQDTNPPAASTPVPVPDNLGSLHVSVSAPSSQWYYEIPDIFIVHIGNLSPGHYNAKVYGAYILPDGTVPTVFLPANDYIAVLPDWLAMQAEVIPFHIKSGEITYITF